MRHYRYTEIVRHDPKEFADELERFLDSMSLGGAELVSLNLGMQMATSLNAQGQPATPRIAQIVMLDAEGAVGANYS